MLGDLKDEYDEVLSEHPDWYIEEFMAFGPKMYQLILLDLKNKEIVKWDKTMKGISVKGIRDLFTHQSLSKYRNPVIDYCCILQYGSKHRYRNLNEVHSMMQILEHRLILQDITVDLINRPIRNPNVFPDHSLIG